MTMAEFKKFNAEKGEFFFSKNTMSFFNSRVESTTFVKGNYFITNEQFDQKSPRLFTVRKADFDTGEVSSVSDFQQFSSRENAKIFIRLQP